MMRTKVTSPSGEVFWVNHPDDATDEEILAYAQANMPKAQAAAPEKAPEWSDIGANILPSGQKFVGGLVDMVTSPVQTLKGVADLGAGALRAGVRKLSPTAAEYIDRFSDPETTQRIEQTATGAGNMLAERYGSVPALKKTIIQDPVGAAADLSTVFTGGATLAPKAGTVANTLRTAAKFTDPLTVPIAASKAVGGAASKGVAPIIGLTSGVGAENIREAYRAGREGGEAGQTFRDNLSGRVSQADVLTQAKEGLANIREDRNVSFRKNAAHVMNDPTPLDASPVVRKAYDLEQSVMHRGMPVVSPAEFAEIKSITAIVDEWKARPELHDVAGLDALKKRLDAAFPDNMNHRQAQRVATNLRNTVKDTIVAQSPKYADVMEAYENSLNMQREIEQGLSLGKKSSQDASLRKLQSLGRNNVNTNYNGRMTFAEQLKREGGVDIMPAIAGQAMSSMTPRGLQTLTGLSSLAGAIHNPAFLAALPFQSPLAMGHASHALGRAVGGVKNAVRDRERWVTFPRSTAITPMQRLDALGQLELERRKKAQQANASRQNSAMGIGY